MRPTAAPDLSAIRGVTVARVHTPPLIVGPPGPCGCGCALTAATSEGFWIAEFADLVLGKPLDAWQRWLVIHAGELLPDGRPRFRRVVVTVARQNGKTYLLAILACYWMYLCGPMLILGSSTKTNQAIKAWAKSISFAKDVPDLAAMIPKRGGVLTGAGREKWSLTNGSVYEPVASNEEGGRGDSLDRVISDELRQHHDYSAYGASYHAMRARPYAQFWGITSMGDYRSIVLNDLRSTAVEYIETGEGDPRLGLFEWSPPKDADPLNPHHLAMANPNVNRTGADGLLRFPLDDLLNEARVAVKKGGQILTDFKTESMNIEVSAMDPAIDPIKWKACLVPGTLDELRRGLVLCIDASLDLRHITLVAAAMLPDGRVRLEVPVIWEGPNAVTLAERDLPGFVTRNKPRKLGWLPGGPAAALLAQIRERKRRTSWPPRGVEIAEISGEVTGACMSFAAAVDGLQIVHSDDPLLNAQAEHAGKLWRSERWRFARQSDTYVDAMYAAAGATLLARTLPTPRGAVRVIVPSAVRSGHD